MPRWSESLYWRVLVAADEGVRRGEIGCRFVELIRRSRTYPGILPLLHLDHFYFDQHLRLECFSLHRTRRSLVASDHLPMVAQFRLPAAESAA